MTPSKRHLLPQFLALYRDENLLLTAKQISERLGVTQTYVSRLLEENMNRAEYRYLKHLRRSACKRGKRHPLYKGEKVVPSLYRNKVEARLGVEFNTTTVVHHIDRNRDNDAFCNLAVMTRTAHTLIHKFMDRLPVHKKFRKSRVCLLREEAWGVFSEQIAPLTKDYVVYQIDGYLDNLDRNNLAAVTLEGLANLRRELPWS